MSGTEALTYQQRHAQEMDEFWTRIENLKQNDPATIRSLREQHVLTAADDKSHKASLVLAAIAFAAGVISFITYRNPAFEIICFVFLAAAICTPLWPGFQTVRFKTAGRPATSVVVLAFIVFALAMTAVFTAGNVPALLALCVFGLFGIIGWGYDFSKMLFKVFEEKDKTAEMISEDTQ